MKKAIAILVSVLLMMSVLSLTAFAAEDDEMVPVVLWQRAGITSTSPALSRMSS